MAQIIRPSITDPQQYHGLAWIFEYTNYDGSLTTWNCGQAATATFLTHHGKMDALKSADNMAWLEANYPPDQLAGWFGTGRRPVERAIRGFDLEAIAVPGVEAIRAELDRANPVLLMLAMPSGKFLGLNLPGGHWMVAYGYEGNHVHLTNGWPMTWADIEAGWRGIAPWWIGMTGRGLARRV